MANKKNTPPSDMNSEQAAVPASDVMSGWRPSRLPRSRQNQKVLLERAALLASKSGNPQAGDRHESYLLFRLGESELYGIQWPYLVEVLPCRSLTRVPGTPASVAGVFNRRGKILCVLDIAELIGLPDRSKDGVNEMIVVQAAGMMVGIVVNELLGCQNYNPAHLEVPLTDRNHGGHGSCVHGIDQGKVTLLDLENLLQHPTLKMSDTTL